MKKLVFGLIVCSFLNIIPLGFAESPIIFWTQDEGHQYADTHESICPKCSTQNAPNASYCGHCGHPLTHSSRPNFFCNQCGKKCRSRHQLYQVKICPSCQSHSNYNSQFCGHCGHRLRGSHQKQYVCKKCYQSPHKDYKPAYSTSHTSSRSYHHQSSQQKLHKPIIPTGPVNVGTFTKGNYKKQATNFPLGSLTSNRSFQTLVIHVSIGEKHAPILNTIKVKQGGRWNTYKQGIRLKNGNNEFSVSVPQGSSELRLSFDHGKNAHLNISLR